MFELTQVATGANTGARLLFMLGVVAVPPPLALAALNALRSARSQRR